MNEDQTRTEIESALQAVLADERFAAAPRMSAFLAYVVGQTLDGAAERIKAYTIGVDALGKPESFDPQGDPSVRVLANRLRASLEDYHRRHPEARPIIEMRRGGYRPLFLSGREASTECPADEAAVPSRPRPPVPLVRLAGTHRPGSLAAQLDAVAGSLLARCRGIGVVRRTTRETTLWPEDYDLLFETIKLAEGRRVEVQLVRTKDDTIVHSATVHLAPGHETPDADEAEVPARALALVEAFVSEFAEPHGVLVRDYRRRGELSPYIVGWLAREPRARSVRPPSSPAVAPPRERRVLVTD